MTIATSPLDTQPLLLDVSNTTLDITPEQFDRLCINLKLNLFLKTTHDNSNFHQKEPTTPAKSADRA